ncbi:MAG: hypothetical protein LBS21_04330 [Clostridiales bacterium]|jgi:hypothetical protein|nr:hypothetical protein [Clostridiales bacterium]
MQQNVNDDTLQGLQEALDYIRGDYSKCRSVFIPKQRYDNEESELLMPPGKAVIIEKLSDEDLNDDEREEFEKAETEFRNGDCVDFEHYLKERGIEAE